MSKKSGFRLSLLSFALLWALLACSPCGWLPRPTPSEWPQRPIEITEEAAQRFQEKIQEALKNQVDGQFRLQFTDQELTSYVNLKLEETEAVPLAEPRIWFTRGKIYVSGEVSSEDLPLKGRAAIVASAQVEDEQIRIHIDQASIGRVPIPRSILDTISDTVNGNLAQAQLDIKVQQLEILEGEAIIVARRY